MDWSPWETPRSRPCTVGECVAAAPIPGRQKSNRSWRARQELELRDLAGLLGPRISRWRKHRGADTPAVCVVFGYI